MPGRGLAPKPPGKRARRNADPVGLRVYTADPVAQPVLPHLFRTDPDTGRRRRVTWPAQTRHWWNTWGAEPLSADFTATDWDFLIDTALLHAKAWGEGDVKLMAEVRIRVAKMGATVEDRARLRITYAAADEADDKRNQRAAIPKPYRGLKAVD